MRKKISLLRTRPKKGAAALGLGEETKASVKTNLGREGGSSR